MGIRVGFHVEGSDYLIFKCFIAKLIDIAKPDIVEDFCPASSRGWQAILETVPAAIQRFYARCAQFAVIGIDNDGNTDLMHTGLQEDPCRPRHWNHAHSHPDCRFCMLQELVTKERTRLTPLPQKPPLTWPVLIAVPVEMIEAWLLELQAIMDSKKGLARAENRARSIYKVKLYSMPEPTRERIELIALPLIRSATPQQIDLLRQRCRSFDDFAHQLGNGLPNILGSRDCWALGDAMAQT